MAAANISIIYYSSTGTMHALAQAAAKGAASAGAEVRMRLVEETAPAAAIDSRPEWKAFAAAHADEPKASGDDMEWADGIIFGAPTRFGNVPAQLKNFIDSLGGLWFQGKLANKVYAGMTSAQNPHGGQESTLLALYNSVHHFGGYIVTPGYTDKLVFESGGNPYGVSATADGEPPKSATLEHASYLGKRVAQTAAKLK